MEGILKFDLNDIDDEMSFRRCNASTDMALVLWDMVYNARKRCEGAYDGEANLSYYDGVDAVLNELIEALDERGINVDRLIN